MQPSKVSKTHMVIWQSSAASRMATGAASGAGVAPGELVAGRDVSAAVGVGVFTCDIAVGAGVRIGVGCGAVGALGLKTPFTLQPGEEQSPNIAKVG